MYLEKASYRAIEFACLYYHYARSVPAVTLAYSVFDDENKFCGVIAFGPGATQHIANPYCKWQGQVVELVRVALNGKHGITSQALGKSLKLIKKDAPLVDLIVSYADVDQEHLGVIYQATNWIYTGLKEAGASGSVLIKGKKMHGRSAGAKYGTRSIEWLRENVDENARYLGTEGKQKYVYPLNDKMKKQVELLRQPYPKK